MTELISDEKGFAAAVINALSSHICVIDKNGVIVAVNRSWQNFAIENPPVSNYTGVGTDYLQVCRNAKGPGSEGAEKFAFGVQAILEGDSKMFQMEYPCHSPTKNRWFLGRVTPLKTRQQGAVISHATITDRKMLEFKLERLALIDSLTNLPNRRYFLKIANLEVERVRRFGQAAAVVMMDLDHFKAINDTYGHAAGDETLRWLSRACKKTLRKTDIFARFGGEEFVIVLPGTNETDACYVAELLRRVICETPVERVKKQFGITASFGVSEIRAGDKTVDECLSRADAALYAAKEEGRNCVMSFVANHRELQTSSS